MTSAVSSSTDRVMLLSIRPRHVAKILDGSKTVELRRTRPVIEPGQPVAIYATLPSGALVATCRIAAIESDIPAAIWRSSGPGTGLSRAEFNAYFDRADTAVALHLEEVSPLVDQVTLSQLRSRGRRFHPPQTWHFVDRQRLAQLIGIHPTSETLAELITARGR